MADRSVRLDDDAGRTLLQINAGRERNQPLDVRAEFGNIDDRIAVGHFDRKIHRRQDELEIAAQRRLLHGVEHIGRRIGHFDRDLQILQRIGASFRQDRFNIDSIRGQNIATLVRLDLETRLFLRQILQQLPVSWPTIELAVDLVTIVMTDPGPLRSKIFLMPFSSTVMVPWTDC